MGITISNRQRRVAIEPWRIRRAGQRILNVLGQEGREVSIVLLDDDAISRLNRQYLQRFRPTNVLAFPVEGEGGESARSPHLGDIAISVETARRQARAVGGRTEDEVLYLMIHGLLHLLGQDHEGSREERREMEAEEKRLFSLLKSESHRDRQTKTRRRGDGET